MTELHRPRDKQPITVLGLTCTWCNLRFAEVNAATLSLGSETSRLRRLHHQLMHGRTVTERMEAQIQQPPMFLTTYTLHCQACQAVIRKDLTSSTKLLGSEVSATRRQHSILVHGLYVPARRTPKQGNAHLQAG